MYMECSHGNGNGGVQMCAKFCCHAPYYRLVIIVQTLMPEDICCCLQTCTIVNKFLITDLAKLQSHNMYSFLFIQLLISYCLRHLLLVLVNKVVYKHVSMISLFPLEKPMYPQSFFHVDIWRRRRRRKQRIYIYDGEDLGHPYVQSAS